MDTNVCFISYFVTEVRDSLKFLANFHLAGYKQKITHITVKAIYAQEGRGLNELFAVLFLLLFVPRLLQ